MMLQRKLNDTADMHYNQEISDKNTHQGDLQLLQKKLENESGKLKALEQYASSLRLLRVKQTEQHAKLEDKVKTLELECATAKKEAVERQAQLEQSSGYNHAPKITELQSAYDTIQQELQDKTLEMEALVEKTDLNAAQTDLIDAERNEQRQIMTRERDALQTELTKIRNQATEDISAMRAQMQKSVEDTAHLLSELEQEKRRITELELMAHPLSLTEDESPPSALTHTAPAPPEQNNDSDANNSNKNAPTSTLWAADGLVATILISVLCAMVLTMVFLFATESGRDFLAYHLELRQEQINNTAQPVKPIK